MGLLDKACALSYHFDLVLVGPHSFLPFQETASDRPGRRPLVGEDGRVLRLPLTPLPTVDAYSIGNDARFANHTACPPGDPPSAAVNAFIDLRKASSVGVRSPNKAARQTLPNAAAFPRTVDGTAEILLYSLRPIAVGEEIFFDYGDHYGQFERRSKEPQLE
jgi:hypothetical protein